MKHDWFELDGSRLPERARAWEKRPDILWGLGDQCLLKGVLVSVVGSRQVSPEGVRRTVKLSKALVDLGITVVSGMAEGVDTAAHQATLAKGGKTVAVMGTPIDECFPAKNESLKRCIAEVGLVISQFPLRSRTFPSNFPRRNELMAALSHMTIVIEASSKSGTRHQVAAAIKLGRPVGFLSSMTTSKIEWVEGALESGLGFEVRSMDDVLCRLNTIKPFMEDAEFFPIKPAKPTRWEQAEFPLDS